MDDLTYQDDVSDLLRAGAAAPSGLDFWFCTLSASASPPACS